MVERKILIRKANLDDIGDILYLYNNYMFDSYLLRFGNSFVKEYLKIIMQSQNCCIFVAVEGHIVGFIMATFNSRKLLSELFFNIEMLRVWIKQILVRPSSAFESLELILYPLNTCLKNINAEFLFIAIESAYRNRNIATNLIKEALSLMKQKGIKKVKVSSLVKNEAVNALLKELEFEIKKTFRLFNKYMYLYSYELH
jgi:ribosomal protein S18 acetylase RimI-like enzyme